MKKLNCFICTLLAALLLLSCAVVCAAEADIIITPQVADGGAISTVCDLSFTFNKEMNAASFTTATVLLKEAVKGSDTYNSRVYKSSYNAASSTLTIHFEEGDIAPCSQYVIEFTESIQAADNTMLSAPVSFTYTTEENGYYINDNFSRYPVGLSLGNSTATKSVLPLYYVYTNHGGRSNGSIVSGTDGKTALQLKATADHAGYYTNVGYRPDYLPPADDVNKHFNRTKIEFELSGGIDTAAMVGGVFFIRRHETLDKFFLYYRATQGGNTPLTERSHIVPLCPVEAPKAGVMTSYKLEYVLATTIAGSSITRRLHEVTFNGSRLSQVIDTIDASTGELTYKDFPAAGLSMTPYGSAYAEYYYQNSQSAYATFAVSRDTALASDGGAVRAEEALLKIYSFKHAPVRPVEKIVTEGDPLFPAGGTISVHFGLTPATVDFSSAVTLTDSAGGSVDWTGSYDTAENVLHITPAAPLAHNAGYTVTVSGSLGYTVSSSAISTADTVKSFTTGWEKLRTSGAPAAVSAGSFAPAFTVHNESLTSESFTARTVLYEKEAGQLHMLAIADAAQTVALGAQATVTAGAVTVPSDGGDYFVKVFLLEAGLPVSEAIVIGTPEEAVLPSVGSSSAVSATGVADAGRIDVAGSYLELPFRALWLTVTEPSGSVVYMDQANSGTSGAFAFGFNLLTGSTGGSYSVLVSPSGGSPLSTTLTMDFSVVKPTLSGLHIEGEAVCGETLRAAYSWFDFAGRADASEIVWYLSESAVGGFTQAAAGKEFVPANGDVGKYVKCVVLPKTSDGVVGITTFETEPLHIVCMPVASNAALSQENNQVSLRYTYSNLLGHEEYQSTYKWYVAESAGGSYTQISNAEALYRVTASDHGKYIKAEVTPRTLLPEGSDAKEYGSKVTTLPLQMQYITAGGNTGGSGGGRGSASGGSAGGLGTLAGSEAPPVYQEPDLPVDTAGTLDLTDVRGHWAEKEIFALFDAGIVTGRADYTYDPEGQLTRAEFAALLVRALGLESVSYRSSFYDVTADDWYADILETAHADGLLDGSDGYALPNHPLTREQMTAMVVRAYEKHAAEIVVGDGLLDFEDAADISQWARQAVGKAKEAGLVQGTGEGRFTPAANTTRAQGAVIVSRLLEQVTAARQAAAEAAAQAAAEAEAAAKAAEEVAKAESAEAQAVETETASTDVSELQAETEQEGGV